MPVGFAWASDTRFPMSDCGSQLVLMFAAGTYPLVVGMLSSNQLNQMIDREVQFQAATNPMNIDGNKIVDDILIAEARRMVQRLRPRQTRPQ